MRKSDKKYSSEYMINPTGSRFSDDSVIYIGKWYYFISDEKTVKNTKIILFILSIIQMQLFLLGAIFCDSLALYTPYVFMPMIALALPLALNISCTTSALSFKEKVTHKQYDKKIKAQKNNTYATAIISDVVLIADIVMCCLNKNNINRADIVFAAFVAIIALTSVLSLKLCKKLVCSCDC